MDLEALVSKYSTPGPRYTSYPTAPQWVETVGSQNYRESLEKLGRGATGPVALYVHLPFCEKLCYYCGCNIQITHDKNRSRSYVEAVKAELRAVAQALGRKIPLAQMSWGGGTPTFLSCDELESVFSEVHACFQFEPDAEISIEIDPRVTSIEQLSLLRRLGFNRCSLGVQDFNPQVQQAVNRLQPEASTGRMRTLCRELGFEGVNFDLIYGLPYQSAKSFAETLQQVISMRPDRIVLYNYARLPSLLKHQSILEKHPIPDAPERIRIFSMALETLVTAGYEAIGMDHFALKEDSLSAALKKGTLYRNFMGYSIRRGEALIGVGASAIGEFEDAFFQNIKSPAAYEETIRQSRFATHRGLLLSADDCRRKWVIQELMCRFQIDFGDFHQRFGQSFRDYFAQSLPELLPLETDGFLVTDSSRIQVTERGRLFVRNLAMVFDAYLHQKTAQFSRTV